MALVKFANGSKLIQLKMTFKCAILVNFELPKMLIIPQTCSEMSLKVIKNWANLVVGVL